MIASPARAEGTGDSRGGMTRAPRGTRSAPARDDEHIESELVVQMRRKDAVLSRASAPGDWVLRAGERLVEPATVHPAGVGTAGGRCAEARSDR